MVSFNKAAWNTSEAVNVTRGMGLCLQDDVSNAPAAVMGVHTMPAKERLEDVSRGWRWKPKLSLDPKDAFTNETALPDLDVVPLLAGAGGAVQQGQAADQDDDMEEFRVNEHVL